MRRDLGVANHRICGAPDQSAPNLPDGLSVVWKAACIPAASRLGDPQARTVAGQSNTKSTSFGKSAEACDCCGTNGSQNACSPHPSLPVNISR